MTEQFDAAAFEALKASLGDQLVEMLLGKFVVQMKEKTARLQTAIDSRDMADVRQQAHDLTSSSGSVGLGAMRDTASACEMAVKQGNEDEGLAKAQELVDMAPATEAAIREAYPNLA
ncbi:MAG: Hpt domain-containing protein [Minwuia sp.]|nr:Hpt domain-containing protein [Minwuia sp.]